ncbi:hypothetical protein CDL15_Pgr002820 [Punica granatum]|uniref:Cytochrome P450 714C2-like n=1 Tax=Punica granatum TaxID=22663 RepID=A0A218X1Q4_PUNGR|nr:hypothetical protein CDL15_Pgr002820 [Punica granatum]
MQHPYHSSRQKKDHSQAQMTMVSSTATVLLSVFLVGLTCLAIYLSHLFWLKPQRFRNKLRRQGIHGPAPSFFFGNIPDVKKIHSEMAQKRAQQGQNTDPISNDYMSQLFPHIDKWTDDYGSVFTFTLGNMVVVCLGDLDAVKDFCQNRSPEFGRSSYIKNSRGVLFGDGIITAKGASWVQQRKIINPEFFPDKVKGMMKMMIESVTQLMGKWEAKVEGGGGIATLQVDEDLRNLSAEVISKTCFGNNYSHGMEIFSKMLEILDLLSKQYSSVGIPGQKYMPTKTNREVWRLGKEVKKSIMNLMINENNGNPQNFLDVLTKNFIGSHSNRHLIVDNCKTMFFAGHETTANTISFTLILLAHHAEWQNRARDEVVEIIKDGKILTADMLNRMKILNMVIYETLRLYPPGPFMAKETSEEMKFGKFLIPKGVNVWLPLSALHRDPANWGADASVFNPERFANGISSACKLPFLFMPFGVGIRTCVGQNYAMTELKIVLALVLSKFSFSLSPEYKHSVACKLFFKPVNAVYLKLERI